MTAGTRLGASEIAVIASTGLAQVEVSQEPRITVVATGNELVKPGDDIEEWQIRSSNGYSMSAALRLAGFSQVSQDHVVDDPIEMARQFAEFLEHHEVLVFSGGVSAGRFDLVPRVLAELGVRELFHKIAQRPGMPMWFGTREDSRSVFALPGNPMSAQICLFRYVIPALSVMRGEKPNDPEKVRLNHAFEVRPALIYCLPVAMSKESGGMVEARPTKGSGDFISLLGTDGFVELPPGPIAIATSNLHPLYRWS